MADDDSGYIWHSPECPFKEGRCYCADSDGEAPPHDMWIKRPTITAQKALASNAQTMATLRAELAKAVEGLEAIANDEFLDPWAFAQSLIKELRP